jgi:hypothetical protein
VTSSEAARHALYAELEQVLGPEHADTLMTSLPMKPADQLATKTDIDRLEDRFDRLEDRFDQAIRTFTVTTVGAMTALTGIFAVVVTVLG